MVPENFHPDAPEDLIPQYQAEMVYECIGCGKSFDINQFLDTCPQCKSLLRIKNKSFSQLKEKPGEYWQEVFDYRKMLNIASLKGIFRFYEFIFPIIPLEDIIYLGEGDTPIVKSNPELSDFIGRGLFVKQTGINPSVSFKDRGMASARR